MLQTQNLYNLLFTTLTATTRRVSDVRAEPRVTGAGIGTLLVGNLPTTDPRRGQSTVVLETGVLQNISKCDILSVKLAMEGKLV